MPFLRFTRDKRGYETTSLVHAIRRQGRSRQRILYWFRTPPGVKVGRLALDEEAIRWIEEHNPDIEFNWPKILEGQPPPLPPAEESRVRRGKRDKPERRRPAPPPPRRRASARTTEPEALPPAEPAFGEADLELQDPAYMVGEQDRAYAIEEDDSDSGPAPAAEDLVEALEQLTHPDAEETIEPSAPPIEQTMGREQLTRMRARYAELQARITERGGDAERIEALRVQAEPLNPDTWVTEGEVRKGLEEFEPKIRDLRAALGLRRRRRLGRGGRRRRGGGEG